MDDEQDLERLNDQLEALRAKAGGAQAMVSAFSGELARLRGTMLYTDKEVKSLASSFGGSLKKAFDGVVFDGDRLSDALRAMGRSMLDAAYATAVKPVQTALGGAIAKGVNGLVSGLLPFEQGGSFAQGRVMPFAKGGVVSGPTTFPMRGGHGLMGEAGPEAIMPLTRGPDGRLGVQAQGGRGGAVHVVMNIQTPDVQGFRRSQSQIAAQMNRALARGHRNQ